MHLCTLVNSSVYIPMSNAQDRSSHFIKITGEVEFLPAWWSVNRTSNSNLLEHLAQAKYQKTCT